MEENLWLTENPSPEPLHDPASKSRTPEVQTTLFCVEYGYSSQLDPEHNERISTPVYVQQKIARLGRSSHWSGFQRKSGYAVLHLHQRFQPKVSMAWPAATTPDLGRSDAAFRQNVQTD